MAVNVSTISSVCLYCKTNSDIDAEKDFHEIYDEVGLELQLPILVETFFHIKVKNDTKQHLCDDCVNRLIELYDLEEHAKEESIKAEYCIKIDPDNVKTEANEDRDTFIALESINNEKSKFQEAYGRCQNIPNTYNPSQSDPKINLHKSDAIEYTYLTHNDKNKNDNQQSGSKKLNDLEYENLKDQIDDDIPAPFTQDPIQDSDIADNFSNENFVIRSENDMTQDFNTSTSTSPTEVTNSNDSERNEHAEFVEDGEDQNIDIEIMVNRNIINTSEVFELKGSKAITSKKCDQQTEAESETIDDNHSKCSDHNNLMEDMYVEETLDDTLIIKNKGNIKTEDSQELDMEDILIEEIDDIYYEEDSTLNEDNDSTNEITNYMENENRNLETTQIEFQNIQETATVSSNSNEAENQNIIAEDIDIDQIIENDQNEGSNDALSLEEEYLTEEITCSQEYDSVDLNEYLDKVLKTKFPDLLLNWDTECKLCLDNYPTFEELIKHSCITQFEEDQQFCCTIKDCEENINNLTTLARHLILKHYDKLESVAIYGKCPDCQKTFSNILDFNKHSCCRNIKRKAGSPNYCQYCDMDFQSLKRYVFHMQFHLTYHRPKICLLCGDLFNNSNDFFEHTQYQHIPQPAMACIKCDRFFKEKDVFDSHMELHEDSKYQYGCTLCPKKYTNKFGLNQHMDIYHNNKSNVIQCDHCEKEFVNKSSYRNHIKSHETDVQVETYICSTCGIITNNLECIKHHMESDRDSPCFSSLIEEKTLGLAYTCENCSLDFLTIRQLKEHRLSKSHSDELYQCSICQQRFKSLRHMRNHSINHKDFKERQAAFPITRYFVCNIGNCQEFYPIWTSLYYHKKRPHKTEENSPNDFICQFCQQLCSSKMSLAVHVARSHNNANVKCSHCKGSFKSQKLLQQHVHKYHTPVECDICFKKFKHRRNLESHNNLVHLNIKRYFCNQCEKGYFHKSERDIHEKKVHPAISYKCSICNFTTNYPNSLEVHMDKHNNQLKFKCKVCSKAFGRKQLLQCHLKRHLNKKDYSCAKYLKERGCAAIFLTYNLLKKHIQTKHQDSNLSINMQKEKQHKKSSTEVLQIEKISYEILNSDDESRSDQCPKTSNFMHLNETDFEQDAIEMVFEDDEQFDEM